MLHRKRLASILLVVSLCFCQAGQAQSLQQLINAAINHHAPHALIGMEVVSLKTGRVLYTRHPHTQFVPASTQKILTATAVLLGLGPDWHWTTTLTVRGHGGHVIIHFSGDPVLRNHQLDELLATLPQHGITQLSGPIYLDRSSFQDHGYGPGWMWDDMPYCYAAPYGAINLEENCVHVALSPHPSQARSQLDSLSPEDVVIRNQIQSKPSALSKHHFDIQVHDNHFTLSGWITGEQPVPLDLAIPSPERYAAQHIQRTLDQMFLQTHGVLITDHPPKRGPIRFQAKHRSPTVAQLIVPMLKRSDNVIADALFLAISDQTPHPDRRWSQSARMLKTILQQRMPAVDWSEAHLVDGSGLSRYNRITPHQLCATLQLIYHTPLLYRTLWPAFPQPRESHTTLAQRFDPDLSIRAKTGTMRHVSSLAGFTQTADHTPIAFALFLQTKHQSPKQDRALIDKLITLIARYRNPITSPPYPP